MSLVTICPYRIRGGCKIPGCCIQMMECNRENKLMEKKSDGRSV
jgi:hypothetical protein